MKISVIIPAFNEEKLIGETLRHVGSASAAFDRRGWAVEWIVCDNNSTDQTADLARESGAKVVFEPVNQIGRARNRGAAEATGDWLIFVDADSRPSIELFDEVAGQIAGGKCLAGGCIVRLDAEYFVAGLVTRGWNRLSRLMKWAAGSFIFCEAKAFREVGGFNLNLYVSEEIDLSRRLKKLARQRRLKLVILHRHPLLTSARKLHLYSRAEHFRFFVKALLSPGRTMTNRGECHPWYDGRR